MGLSSYAHPVARTDMVRAAHQHTVIATGVVRPRGAAAPCTNEDAYNTTGIWIKQKPDNFAGADRTFPKSQYVAVTTKAQQAVDLLKSATPDFKGIQAYAYRSITGDSYSPNGALRFRVDGVYDAYICVGNNTSVAAARGTVLLNGDTFWITIRFNDVGNLLTEKSVFSPRLVTASGGDIYVAPKHVGELKGFPLFTPLSKEGGTHEAVLLTANNQSPFSILTREGYLQSRIRAAQRDVKSLKDRLSESTARMASDIKKVDDNSVFTAQQRTSVKESFRRTRLDQETVVANMDADVAALVQVLSNMPAAERSSQAIVRDPVALPSKGSLFASESEGGKPLVIIDPGFFDAKLPRSTVQLIAVCWSWDDKHPAKNRAVQQFKGNFDFDALSHMLGK